jgi:hypothetical protein
VVRIALRDRYELGGEFFRWEMATAVAGALLGVESSTSPTWRVRTTPAASCGSTNRTAPCRERQLFEEGLALFASAPTVAAAKATGTAEALRRFVAECGPDDYLAIMAYLLSSAPVQAAVEAVRLSCAIG